MTSTTTRHELAESTRTAGRIVLRLVVLASLVLAATTVGAAADPSADDALDAKKEAERLLDDLEALDERPEVTVDQGVLDAVRYNVDRGTLDFANDNYASSTEHFEAATEQAKAELADAYVEAAAVTLDTVDRRVTAVVDAGYENDETAALSVQVENERDQLADVDSYADAREAYQDARTLHDRAADLPSSDEVSTAMWLDDVTDSWPTLVGVGAGVLVVAGVCGWAVRRTIQESREPPIRTH